MMPHETQESFNRTALWGRGKSPPERLFRRRLNTPLPPRKLIIKVFPADTTKNKNAYYIYTKNEEAPLFSDQFYVTTDEEGNAFMS